MKAIGEVRFCFVRKRRSGLRDRVKRVKSADRTILYISERIIYVIEKSPVLHFLCTGDLQLCKPMRFSGFQIGAQI